MAEGIEQPPTPDLQGDAAERTLAAAVQLAPGPIRVDPPLTLRAALAANATAQLKAGNPPQAGTAPVADQLVIDQQRLAGESGLHADINVVPPSARLSTGPTVSYRDNPEGAESLTRALSATVKGEIERLESKRLNEPEWQDQIDFLKFVSLTLDQIATAIGEARQAATADAREEKLKETETLAQTLARECRGFAERNRKRVVDFDGFSAFTILGTLLYTQMLGVPAADAMWAQLALLGISVAAKK